MEFLRLIVLTLHFLGMAVVVGVFLVQMRQADKFKVGLLVAGAAAQLVTGLALVGLAEPTGHEVNYMKAGFKLAITLIALVGAGLAVYRQRRGEDAKPFFHTAGGLALVNVLVAVLWS